MTKGQKLPPNHHVVRYVPWSKLRKDESDNVIGVLGTAFQPRPTEQSLSATWMEYFSGERRDQLCHAVHVLRGSINTGAKSGFAIGNVGAILSACSRYKVRILHDPEENNDAHVGVRGIPQDDFELLELLAAEAWSEWILNSKVPLVGKPSIDP